jgi:hypothetical protein
MNRIDLTLQWLEDHHARVFLIGAALLFTAHILGF